MKKLILIAVILLLCACGNQTIRADKPEYVGLAQAKQYFEDKYYNKAARAYEHLYMTYKQDKFALVAADSWARIGQFENAQNLLAALQLSELSGFEKSLSLLIQAEIFAQTGQAAVALAKLQQIPKNSLNNDLGIDYSIRLLQIQAKIYAQNNLFLEAGLLFIELSIVDGYNDYTQDIINNLSQTPQDLLNQALYSREISEFQQGWLEAASIANQQDAQAIKQWQARWQDHPAQIFFAQMNAYNNIAVLLPLTGKYQEISSSIQAGMLAALYRNGSAQQRLNFFDTGSNSEFFSNAWYGAIESGAEFVIGPLLKDSIKQLSILNSTTVPVMLLNQLEEGDNNPNGFYQFALSQIDEVRNVANRLKAENKNRIMILAPETVVGRNLARALEADILFNDGQVVSYAFYPESSHDYSIEIKQALGLNDSVIRKRQLQSIVAVPLEFNPQIRPDIDAIVILARPQQARLIKPQLKFYQAENIPVYSTSQLFSDVTDTALNKDLNGIKFCHAEFVIEPESLQDVLNFDVTQIKVDKKFFAFGYDAVVLAPRLHWLQSIPNQSLESMSGHLSMDGYGKIRRDLAWAQFKAGKPVLLPPLVAEPTEIYPQNEAIQ